MSGPVRLLAWAALACALVAAGFAALVFGSSTWLSAQAEPGAALRMHSAFAVYFRVVLGKGLLPAAVGAVALWPLLDGRRRFSRRGRCGVALGIAVAATLSSVAVAALLLPRAWPGLPAVAFRGPANFAQSAAELAAGVAAALGLARALLGLRGRRSGVAAVSGEPALGVGTVER